VGFTPNKGISSEYVLYCLRFYQEYFEHRAPKSAQMNINLDKLRSLRMPMPPEPLQLEFARFVRETRDLKRLASDQEHLRSELLKELTGKAYSGDLTSLWRNQNHPAITEAANKRDALLRERGVKIATSSLVASKSSGVAFRLSRAWLMNELSEFQLGVFYAFAAYAEQPLLAEDPEIFARFCESEEVNERVEPFGPAQNNRIRRTLSQLSALGLIAKVTLPTQNQETGEREYLKAFRPLREEEFTRLSDAAALRNALGVGGEPQLEIES
jgi:type I restriction enzyme, S subunit